MQNIAKKNSRFLVRNYANRKVMEKHLKELKEKILNLEFYTQ